MARKLNLRVSDAECKLLLHSNHNETNHSTGLSIRIKVGGTLCGCQDQGRSSDT